MTFVPIFKLYDLYSYIKVLVLARISKDMDPVFYTNQKSILPLQFSTSEKGAKFNRKKMYLEPLDDENCRYLST